jgi:hypothetical protein
VGTGIVPPDLLVTPGQLSRYNVPAGFLAQFAARPFLLQITTGGTLGVMQFAWQYSGDSAWSPPIASAAGNAFQYTIDDTFADLTFGAATYNVGDTYNVDAFGNVTGPSTHVAAARFDLRQTACSAATTEALMLMADAVHPPLQTWGDDVTTHAAALAYAILKRGRGATPQGAGVGDANVFDAEKIAREFFKRIGENGMPSSMTDSSSSTDGPLIPVYPFGDPPRGW